VSRQARGNRLVLRDHTLIEAMYRLTYVDLGLNGFTAKSNTFFERRDRQ
jgi:hypothetical protein